MAATFVTAWCSDDREPLFMGDEASLARCVADILKWCRIQCSWSSKVRSVPPGACQDLAFGAAAKRIDAESQAYYRARIHAGHVAIGSWTVWHEPVEPMASLQLRHVAGAAAESMRWSQNRVSRGCDYGSGYENLGREWPRLLVNKSSLGEGTALPAFASMAVHPCCRVTLVSRVRVRFGCYHSINRSR